MRRDLQFIILIQKEAHIITKTITGFINPCFLLHHYNVIELSKLNKSINFCQLTDHSNFNPAYLVSFFMFHTVTIDNKAALLKI